MPLNPGPLSRFKLTEAIVDESDQETFGLLREFIFLNRNNLTDDQIGRIQIDATYAGKLDLLADFIYGDVRLHWIFILFNNIQNPFGYPFNGQIVEYPLPSVVLLQV